MTELLTAVLGAIEKIRTPLQFFAAILVFFCVISYIVLNSPVAKREMGLRASQTYALLKRVVLYVFIFALLLVVVGFTAPVVLQWLEGERQIRQGEIELSKIKTISELQLDKSESKAIVDEFEAVLAEFQGGNYDSARARFLSLRSRVQDSASRDVISGLVTATYYVSGQHLQGLQFICDNYRDLPPQDVRFRFAVHAHVRRVAFEKFEAGMDWPAIGKASDAFLAQLPPECLQRHDFASLWAFVPLGFMEGLEQGEILRYSRGRISKGEVDGLRRFARANPSHPFVDHAHYFSGDFKAALARKLSIIRDTVLFAHADAQERAGDLDAAATTMRRVIAEFPSRREAGVGLLVDYLRKGQKYVEAMAVVRQHQQYFSWMGPGGSIPDFVYADWESRGEAFYRDGRYAEALSYYVDFAERLRRERFDVPAIVERKIPELRQVVALKADHSAQGVLRLAGYLRNNAGRYFDPPGRHLNAAAELEAFIRRADVDVTSDAAAKRQVISAYYLAAASWRVNRRYDRSAARLREATKSGFLEASPLADDIHAELGWHSLHVQQNPAASLRSFDFVLEQFPGSNAADNAAYHALVAAERLGRYATAARYAARLWQITPTSRFVTYLGNRDRVYDRTGLSTISDISWRGLGFGGLLEQRGKVYLNRFAGAPLRCDGKIRPGARVNLVNDVEVDDVIRLMTTLQNLGDQPVRFFLGDADDDGVIDDGVTCTYG
jgi:tetratricopeptide (TPR) repeat protein